MYCNEALIKIAAFTFNRPKHTAQTLNSLAASPLFRDLEIHLFSDGPRNPKDEDGVFKTREILHSLDHPNKHLHFSEINKGLFKSITEGISLVLENSDSVIVLEDDLELSPDFLPYMQEALGKYANAPNVMQISGHSFVETDGSAYFLPFTTSWGWGTWKRAWNTFHADNVAGINLLRSYGRRKAFDLAGTYPYSRMLSYRLQGKNNSWAIWMYYQAFIRNGLTLYPPRTLVNNNGFDGSGTHCGNEGSRTVDFQKHLDIQLPDKITIDQPAYSDTRKELQRIRGIRRNVLDAAWRMLYPLLPDSRYGHES